MSLDVTIDEPSGTTQTRDRSTDTSTGGRWRRRASAGFGGLLVVRGLRRRSLGGLATALAGGWLVYRSLGGRSRVFEKLGEARGSGSRADAMDVERSITIGRPADELDEYWRDPEQLTRILGDIVVVTDAGGDQQEWTVRGPLDRGVSWQTRIVEDNPGESLYWESLPGESVTMAGSVRFRPAPGDRGTEVTLHLRLDTPGGAVGGEAMRLLEVIPDTLVGQALRRYKSLAETGEIPTLEKNPSARGSGDLL